MYEGVVSGVTEWGLYVELDENMCEGLVPVRDLPGDYYDFDEKNYALVGRRTGVRYRLGDKVKVQVTRCSLERKQLDFALLDDKGNPYTDTRRPGEGSRSQSSGKQKRGSKKRNPSGRKRSK